MRDLRLQSWQTYESLPMPTRQDEEWRRTDLRRHGPGSPERYHPQRAHHAAERVAARRRHHGHARRGAGRPRQHAIHREVAPELAAKGVIFTDMDTRCASTATWSAPYFMQEAVKPGFSKFSALNGALWSGGTFLYVPDNTEVSLPLQSSLWLDERGLRASSPTPWWWWAATAR